jgi:hypothetical protein
MLRRPEKPQIGENRRRSGANLPHEQLSPADDNGFTAVGQSKF